MTTRAFVAALLLCPAIASAQATPAPQPSAQPPGTPPAPLPVRRVVLYKTGIGYFEHLGRVRGSQDVTIRFTSGQLNDVLKSLTTIDLGKGRVTGISYNSVAPIQQRLGALRLPLAQEASMADLLRGLRGVRVEVASGSAATTGRVLSLEAVVRTKAGEPVELPGVSIVTEAGEIRTFELTPETRVRILERDLRQEIGRYLDVVGSTRERDVRSMTISTSGTGERPLLVSYVSEVPIWKTTYRLVMPPKGGTPLLQGWAIVDNTIGEDWKDVELSLVAGAPQSFIQQISLPYYAQRPVVPLPRHVLTGPQTHQATLSAGQAGGAGGVVGGVRESVVTSRQSAIEHAPPPPPPPPARPAREAVMSRGLDEISAEMRNTATAATGRELGDLFEYRVKEPVTLQKNQSALVPIVNADIAAEKVALWTAGQSSTRPLRAVWITNTSGLTLDGGSITILDGNAFAGEGLVEPLQAGERRLVSYAADLAVLVKANVESSPARMLRLRARDGVLLRESEDTAAWTYTARNEDDEPITLVIEHRLRPGWKLAPGQTPAESTVDRERFRVVLAPKKESTLVVREARTGETRIAIGDVSDDLVAQVAAAGIPSADLERALKPVIDKRAEVARVDARLTDLRSQQTDIVADQGRLRENMKALRGSAEERQLLQRYTRQLDEQETKLESIKTAIATATAERERLSEELSKLISEIAFDVKR